MLEADESNVQSSFTLLGHYGILKMYDRLTAVYDELHQEIINHITSSTGFPFMRTNAQGNKVPAWDLFLRIYMLASAYQEFTIAGGHLFEVIYLKLMVIFVEPLKAQASPIFQNPNLKLEIIFVTMIARGFESTLQLRKYFQPPIHSQPSFIIQWTWPLVRFTTTSRLLLAV